MKEFELIISTPDGEAYRGSVSQLSVRGTEGEIGILAGHIPFVTAIVPSECRIYTEAGILRFNCGGGLMSVQGGRVTVLSSSIGFLSDT